MRKTSHTIIIGDSRNMDELDDESVHLIVTSPPYPMIDGTKFDFRVLIALYQVDVNWSLLNKKTFRRKLKSEKLKLTLPAHRYENFQNVSTYQKDYEF